MYFEMLKKDIKQFFREKFNIVILMIFPIILITALSVGLESMMDGTHTFDNKDEAVVFYTIDEKSPYKEEFEEFLKALNETVGINYKETKNLNEVKHLVDDYKGLAHIDFKGENIKYYASEKGAKMDGRIFKEIFDSFLKECGSYETIGYFNKGDFRNFVKNKYETYVEEDMLNGKKSLKAGEFYTFAELALIIAFLGVTIGELTFKEKRLSTVNRIVMSRANHFMMILSKISLGVIVGTLQTILIYIYTSTALKIDWGENTFKFILLFIVFALFMSIIGAVVGSLAKTEGVVGGTLNMISVVWGALGGTFTPLAMIISIPVVNKLVYLSPIYWISTSTSTMLCGFDTVAYKIALGVPVVFSVFLIVFYLIKSKNKEEILNA